MNMELSLPNLKEMKLAESIGKELSTLINSKEQSKVDIVFRKDHKEVSLSFPLKALHLLIRIMEQMALGNTVTLVPLHAQLTTQEAADFLNVSRPFIVRLLKTGEIPFIKVGSHRRILFEDLMAYKKKMFAESEKAMEELARLGQELEEEN